MLRGEEAEVGDAGDELPPPPIDLVLAVAAKLPWRGALRSSGASFRSVWAYCDCGEEGFSCAAGGTAATAAAARFSGGSAVRNVGCPFDEGASETAESFDA